MRMHDYIDTLKLSLDFLPESEVEDILNDVREHFANGLEEGKSEEEISALLGNPVEMANQYRRGDERKTFTNAQRETHSSGQSSSGDPLRSILLVIISFFVLIPVIVVYSLLLAMFCIGLAFVIAAFALMLGTGVVFMIPVVSFISQPQLIVSAIGFLLLGAGVLYLSALLFKLVNRAIKDGYRHLRGSIYA